MKTQCLVSADDYRVYWQDEAAVMRYIADMTWSGLERRISADRRSGSHERRWEQARGRRFRASDRRKS